MREGNAESIIDDIIGRTGRILMRDGGATWAGDDHGHNAPSEKHWIPIMMGMVPIPEDMSEEEREALVKPRMVVLRAAWRAGRSSGGEGA